MVCAGFLEFHAETESYSITPGRARCLADETFPMFVGGWSDMLPAIYRAVPGVTEAIMTPGKPTGVPFALQSEWGFSRGMDRSNGPAIKSAYVRKWLAHSLPETVEMLKRGSGGVKVADLGTGCGAVALSLANAFPSTTVVGCVCSFRPIVLA
jgi:hypothetical protein